MKFRKIAAVVTVTAICTALPAASIFADSIEPYGINAPESVAFAVQASDSERPELPEGEMPQMPPQMPGERPELPEGEMPQMPPQMTEERPELPEGEMPQMPPEMTGERPELPEGEMPQMPPEMTGERPELPEGEMPQMPESGEGTMQNGTGFQPGQPDQQGNQDNPGQPGMSDQGAPTSFDAATILDKDSEGANYSSTADNENAVLVSGKQVSISGSEISKTGNASGENADFYGTNAAVLANDGADLTITGANITTDGAHANAVFSNGSETSVTISDSTITTTGNNSGGLMTTGGASMTATNLTVNTSGNSSAAIRSDRGGGTVNVTEGSYSSSGVGSPAIYSTADITVSDAVLSAANSEAVVIEGGNSVTLINSDVTGNNAKLNGQSTIKTNVLIYQSMSGDASEGSSDFTMSGGTLISETGAMFHVTNVTTTIDLTGVTIVNASDSNDFLIASADSWGTSGRNGGNVTLKLSDQIVNGNITVDSISSLTINAGSGTSYTGAINTSGTAGKVSVVLSDGATWTLTGDSYITSFDGDVSAVNTNGYTLYVNGVAVS